MIKETKDYVMFKKHPSNRPLVESLVEQLMKSIQIKNLLEYRPILVDKDHQVIDGQHRLEAAKRLGVEIFYQVEKKSETADMFLLNSTQRRWYPEDYLHYYCGEGKQDYIKFREYIIKNGLDLTTGLNLLWKFSPNSQYKYKKFNSGEYVFPNSDKIIEANEMLDRVKIFKDYLTVKMTGYDLYLNSNRFSMAFLDFLTIYAINFNDFMKKLPFRLELMRPCSRKEQYIEIFKSIYNFRNHNPITD